MRAGVEEEVRGGEDDGDYAGRGGEGVQAVSEVGAEGEGGVGCEGGECEGGFEGREGGELGVGAFEFGVV